MNTRSSTRPMRIRRSAEGIRECWPTLAFFIVLAFDFHAEIGEERSAQQYVVFLGALTFGVIGSYRLFAGEIARWKLPAQAWLIMAAIAIAILLFPIHQATFANFTRLLSPYLLCLLGALLAEATARQSPVNQSHVLTTILAVGLMAGAWTFFYGTAIRGLDLFEGRFALVSAIIPQVFAMAMLVLAYPLPQRWLAGVVVVMALLLFVISITRTYMTTAAGIVAYLFLVVASRGMSLRNLRIVLISVTLLVVGSVGTVVVLPEFVNRWEERLFNETTGGGEQVTAVTREAEWVSQINMLRSSPQTLIIGNGLGARYFWDERTLSKVEGWQDIPEYREGVTEAGHSLWIFSAFSAGLLSGWMIPLMLILTLYQGAEMLFTLRKVQRKRDVDPRLSWDIALGSIYFSSVLATFMLSFSSTPFVDRFSAGLFGFSVVSSRSYLMLARRRAQLTGGV